MSSPNEYVENCRFIRAEFNQSKEVGIYELLDAVVKAYKQLKEIVEKQNSLTEGVNNLKKENKDGRANQDRKRGRPAKRTGN